jgi:hypothetical protein
VPNVSSISALSIIDYTFIMGNAEILETLGTQEEFEDTKGVINNGQC